MSLPSGIDLPISPFRSICLAHISLESRRATACEAGNDVVGEGVELIHPRLLSQSA